MSMTILSLLVALACLVVLPEIFFASRRFDRLPHTGLVFWGSLCAAGWLSTVVFFLKVGIDPSATPLRRAVMTFVSHLSDGHPLRGLGMIEVVGLSFSLDIVVLFGGGLTMVGWQTWRRRVEQRAVLDMVAEESVGHAGASVSLLTHTQPMAYYLPGRGGRVVLSTGAVHLLSDVELSAVLAHEQGHHEGHHGLFLVPLQTLASFVKFLPLSRRAPLAMRGYLEMIADDYAAENASRGALLSAISKAPAFQYTPRGAFGIADQLIQRRVRRLDQTPASTFDVAAAFAVGAFLLSFAITVVNVG
jgi:hypothetical protein